MSYDVDYGAKTSQSNDSDKIKEINEAKDPDLQPDEGQTIYMIEFESEPNEKDHVKGKNGRDNDSGVLKNISNKIKKNNINNIKLTLLKFWSSLCCILIDATA